MNARKHIFYLTHIQQEAMIIIHATLPSEAAPKVIRVENKFPHDNNTFIPPQ
jgi:hypothetical protein